MPAEPTATPPLDRASSAPRAAAQTARSRVAFGDFSAEAEIQVTPAGLLAFGGLVSLILLSIVPIVRAARRREP